MILLLHGLVSGLARKYQSRVTTMVDNRVEIIPGLDLAPFWCLGQHAQVQPPTLRVGNRTFIFLFLSCVGYTIFTYQIFLVIS